jgi:hypothetical protein
MKLAHHFAHDYKEDRDAQEHACVSLGKVWNIETKRVTNG